MIHDEMADLIQELCQKYQKGEVARHFGRSRKWIYYIMDGCNFLVNPELVAGLRYFGYDIKIVRRKDD